MQSFILKENVLTDDVLHLPNVNYLFKGGLIAIIESYTFQNTWSDKKELINFRSRKSLQKYLSKHYPNFEY